MRKHRIAYAQTLLGLAFVKREQGDFAQATKLAREAMVILEQSAVPAETLTRARIELAEILRRKSELEEASALASLALQGAPPGAARARALIVLGRIRSVQGELEQAEQLLQEAYDLQLKLEGPLGEMTFEAKSGLAEVLVMRGEPQRAEPILREIVNDARKVYGDKHAEVGVALNNLANAIADIPEKRAEAADVYLEAAAILRVAKGPNHPEVGTTYNNLGALYISTQQWSKAADVFREAIAIRSASLGPVHPDTATAKHGRALALNKLGNFARRKHCFAKASLLLLPLSDPIIGGLAMRDSISASFLRTRARSQPASRR